MGYPNFTLLGIVALLFAASASASAAPCPDFSGTWLSHGFPDTFISIQQIACTTFAWEENGAPIVTFQADGVTRSVSKDGAIFPESLSLAQFKPDSLVIRTYRRTQPDASSQEPAILEYVYSLDQDGSQMVESLKIYNSRGELVSKSQLEFRKIGDAGSLYAR